MSFISFCDNATCWQRRQCLRWMQADPGYDVTHNAIPVPADGEPCDEFVALMPGDRVRTDGK